MATGAFRIFLSAISKKRLRAESYVGEAQLFRQRRRLSSKAFLQRSRALSSADFCKSDSGRRLTTSPISTLVSASLLFLGDLRDGAVSRGADGHRPETGPVTRRARPCPPRTAAARLLAAAKNGAYSPPNRNNTGLRCNSPAGPAAR